MSPSPRVMIVEDDAEIREALAMALEEFEIQAVVAANGLEALELLEGARSLPDVILLDVMMPVMDGWAFRAKQRQKPPFASIPVVVFTAHANAEETAEKMGAEGYLKKPVDLDALVENVRRFASR